FLDGTRAYARLRLPVNGSCAPAVEVPEILAPSTGDLVPFTFRLLSAAYLGCAGYHLDFSREDMLERALPLFKEPEAEGSDRRTPLVVVRDHSFSIEDRIGLVRNARWSPADGAQGLIQSGIEADLYINWKLAGDAVRRLLHDPPLLDACSVSLGFSWEKSHPALDDGQFWMRLGEELDGSPVRIVVTRIETVEHVGLVYAGADPHARRLDVGVNAERTSLRAQLAERGAITIPLESPVWELLGMEQPDAVALENRARDLYDQAQLGQDVLEELRREVTGQVVQLDGARETEASRGLLQLVQVADLATLRALRDEYARNLETLIPAVCQLCGSEQVARRSSHETETATVPGDVDDPGLYR
ncbi:hypothetical protein ACFL5M_06410, partial [Candidatus Neomarinimicrobiota bacterium]